MRETKGFLTKEPLIAIIEQVSFSRVNWLQDNFFYNENTRHVKNYFFFFTYRVSMPPHMRPGKGQGEVIPVGDSELPRAQRILEPISEIRAVELVPEDANLIDSRLSVLKDSSKWVSPLRQAPDGQDDSGKYIIRTFYQTLHERFSNTVSRIYARLSSFYSAKICPARPNADSNHRICDRLFCCRLVVYQGSKDSVRIKWDRYARTLHKNIKISYIRSTKHSDIQKRNPSADLNGKSTCLCKMSYSVLGFPFSVFFFF